ncbi:iron chelate uptake ABC transporter family permease subunit [Corynebacterium sp. H127]|uniref:FecCD family ABC transporter permease n=1 Tax=Corynebacterium sp. H127 TaxID=3133418 RepID=UPI0030A5E1BC
MQSKPLALSLVIGILLAALCSASLLSLAVGARAIALPEVLASLIDPYSSPTVSAVVWDRRIPRTLIALTVGMSLGLAGTLIQALTSNPLADTGVLGINAGAAFAIVTGLAFGIQGSAANVFVLALAGAFLAGAGVYVISRTQGVGVDPLRLILAGVALSAILGGIGDGLALVNPQAFDRLKGWMLGSVDTGSYQPLVLAALGLVVGAVLAASAARGLDALALGEEMATSMGANVARTRLLTFLAVAILAASATAAAGVIVFLGLMVPHLARWLVGSSFGRLLATSMLLGPLVLLLSDIVGRVIIAGEFPAGIVVSFIGAPFLIAYAQSAKRGV